MSGPSLQVPHASERDQERKLVTVLFADVAGSTALAERLDPEDMRAILTATFNAMARELRRFEGTVDKYAGDAVMAVFGAPTAHEDDAVRALRAAQAMLEAIARLNAEFERDRNVRVALRIGVNTGVVAAGPLTGEQSGYTIVGDAVNTAQRLQSVAEPGTILVGATTQRLAQHAFAFDAVEPVRVKGKAEPLAAFRLARPLPAGATALRSSLVGRDAELALLVGAVGSVERGEGRIVLLTGEAGIGKTRLLSEARAVSAERDVTLLVGRALSITQGVSYLPFVQMVKQDAGIAEDDAQAVQWQKLSARLTSLFADEAIDVLPYVATLIGVAVPDELIDRVRYLDAQAMGQHIFASVRAYIARLARERALVLIFEDLHWADASSAALIEHLLPLVETERVGICAASRPDEPGTVVARFRDAARTHESRLIELHLDPLSANDSERLVRNLLTIEDLPPEVGARILERTEGNPLFVEEVIRTLIEVGGIVRDGENNTWRPTEKLEGITIPDTVQGVIVARIDRLDEEVKQIIKLASVIGRSFLYRILRALAEANAAVDDALGQLQSVDLIRERSHLPELEYIFKHALVHDAAYESILLRRRKELHAAVGDAIERLFAGRIEEFYGVLAYHYARAERWEKAQAYLFKAGDRAERIAGDSEALGLYRQALAAYARAYGERWDPVQRAMLERKMGEALFRRGERSEGREHLLRALELLGRPFPRSRPRIWLHIVGHTLRQVGHRKAPFLFPIRPDPTVAEVTRIGEVMAWIDFFTSPDKLVLTPLRMANYSEEASYDVGIAHASMAIGIMCNALALHGVAAGYYGRSVAVAEASGNLLNIGIAYTGLGYHEQHALGRGEIAQRHYERATAAYREAGDLWRWSSPLTLWSMLRRYRGELRESLTLAEEVVHAAENGGDLQMRVWGLLRVGGSLSHMGDLDDAEAQLRLTIELSARTEDFQANVCALGFLGELLLLRGRADEAIAVLERGTALVAEHHLRTFYATQAMLSLAEARLLAMEDQGSRGRDAVRKALGVCKRQTRIDREAVAGMHRWSGTYAWLDGKPEAARAAWERSLAVARDTGGRYEEGLTLLERGRRTGTSGDMDAAAKVFDAIGARARLAQAKALL